MIAKTLLLMAVAGLCASIVHGNEPATMTLKNGKVINLTQLRKDVKGKCCLTAQEIGLVKVDGDNTIVRMENSRGNYFVTNDPNCGNVIYSSSYPTSFSNVYLCNQCKGGCPQVDGGKNLVPQGGSCKKPDGSYDINNVCIASAPVCLDSTGKCGTFAESQAPPPPAACASFSNLGQDCNLSQGKCCGGGPKNAKCENGKCVTTYPTPPPAPVPAPTPAPACASFSNLGQDCNLSQGKCCGGGPKNAKCENGKCVTTYPTGRRLF